MWCSTGRCFVTLPLFSILLISLKNFDSLVMVYTLVRCSWAASFMPTDDIVLLSGNCYGLQKMVDICSDYGNRFGIRFNSSKSQLSLEGVLPLILLYS